MCIGRRGVFVNIGVPGGGLVAARQFQTMHQAARHRLHELDGPVAAAIAQHVNRQAPPSAGGRDLGDHGTNGGGDTSFLVMGKQRHSITWFIANQYGGIAGYTMNPTIMILRTQPLLRVTALAFVSPR